VRLIDTRIFFPQRQIQNIPFKSIHFTEKGKALDSGARIFDQFGGLNSLDQDTLYTGMN
jgi:hypothetical protein